MLLVQSRAGLLEHCFASYERMQELGLAPDSHTLSSLVGAFSRAGQTFQAQQVFDTLFPKHDIEPDVTAWNSIMGAFASAGDKVNLVIAWRSSPEKHSDPCCQQADGWRRKLTLSGNFRGSI